MWVCIGHFASDEYICCDDGVGNGFTGGNVGKVIIAYAAYGVLWQNL